MLRFLSRMVCAAAVLVPGLSAAARAQTGQPVCTCQCVQPVVQPIYQTVPVTEYRALRQTVQRPVVERQWEDRQVTAYRPITESRTAEVPTVYFEDVTEYRTVNRDMGYWTTQYYARPQLGPCEYDPRPGLMGWLNRTGFEIRQVFTPKVFALRQYVPNVVSQTIPVTRRVSRQATQQVTYNVTRMEPYTTTKRVAVDHVRMVHEDVLRNVPVTVMRSVPIGSRVAYAATPFAPTGRTVLGPTPDPAASRRAAATSPARSANSATNPLSPISPATGNTQKFQRREPEPFQSDPQPFQSEPAPFNGDGASRLDSSHLEDPNLRQSSYKSAPARNAAEPPSGSNSAQGEGFRPTAPQRRGYPSVVRVQRTTALYRGEDERTGPSLVGPGIAVVDNQR